MEINEPSLTMIAKLTNHFLINRILHPVRPGKPRETEELSEFKAIIRCDFFFLNSEQEIAFLKYLPILYP